MDISNIQQRDSHHLIISICTHLVLKSRIWILKMVKEVIEYQQMNKYRLQCHQIYLLEVLEIQGNSKRCLKNLREDKKEKVNPDLRTRQEREMAKLLEPNKKWNKFVNSNFQKCWNIKQTSIKLMFRTINYLSMCLTKDMQTLVRVSECKNQRGEIQKDGQLNLQEAKRVDMAS